MQQLVEGVNIPKFEVSTQALDAMRNITDNSAMRIAQDNMNVMKSRALQMSPKINAAIASANNNAFKSIGKLAIKSSLHNYQFDIPAIKILDDLGKNATANLISGLNTLVNNSAMRELLKSGKTMDEIHSELLSLVKYPKYYEFDHYTYVDERGPFRASDLTAPGSKARYDVIHPVTKKPCKTGTRGWAYSESEMNKLIENNYILFGETETVMPQLKNYLFDNEKSLPKSVLFFDSQSSTKWMKAQKFGFDFPKAIDYIKYVLSMYPKSDCEVLDFFSGSATTAHSVMQLNAEDGGHRKFIMVQLPEVVDEKSEAYKAGYKNICEIGKERIRRAAKKIAEENPEAKFDGGFRVLKCDTSNMKDIYYNPNEYEPSLFTSLEDNIKEDRTSEDLLFQVMLDLGVLLSSKIEETTIAGKIVFNVENNYLIACFDGNVTEEVITEIAKQKPYYFVMRDSSMANDSVATNFEQIFAAYSPETVRKVL